MQSANQWVGNQIKNYVTSNIPSWNNLSGNISSKAPVAFVSAKPPLTTNFIWCSYEGSSDIYIVEPFDDLDPATVKPRYEEIY